MKGFDVWKDDLGAGASTTKNRIQQRGRSQNIRNEERGRQLLSIKMAAGRLNRPEPLIRARKGMRFYESLPRLPD